MANNLSNHNFLHILSVIFGKFINLIIACFISSYMTAIGLLLSEEALKYYIARLKLAALYDFILTIPYIPKIKTYIFNLIAPWYKTAPMWWAMVVGIPLMLSGLSIIIIGLTDFNYSITNAAYNRIHCLFHKKEKINNSNEK